MEACSLVSKQTRPRPATGGTGESPVETRFVRCVLGFGPHTTTGTSSNCLFCFEHDRRKRVSSRAPGSPSFRQAWSLAIRWRASGWRDDRDLVAPRREDRIWQLPREPKLRSGPIDTGRNVWCNVVIYTAF